MRDRTIPIDIKITVPTTIAWHVASIMGVDVPEVDDYEVDPEEVMDIVYRALADKVTEMSEWLEEYL